MFTVNNIIIAFFAVGMAGIFLITYIMSRQCSKVNGIMQQNKNVAPLLLQKSTQHKFNTIRSKMPHSSHPEHDRIRIKLDELVSQFKAEAICIKKYNHGLDQLMKQLNTSKQK